MSTRLYFIRQLYRREGKHYQRITKYIGLARIEVNLITNTGPATWDIMTKIMYEVNLDFWAKALTLTKKTFYPKKNTNPMELFISEEKPYAKTMKQILIPTTQISIRNPAWQLYSWDLRKLKNIIQLHENDPHMHDSSGTEHYPKRCKFRKINTNTASTVSNNWKQDKSA